MAFDLAPKTMLFANTYAVIYTRVSSGRQVQNTSLDEQERVCREYCARHGWHVLEVFREEGESAKASDRTQLINAMQFCRENKPRPSYFVVYDVKRFARNADDHFLLRKTLDNWDVQLRAATQNIGERKEERFLEVILSGEAEYDNAVRKERSMEGMAARLKNGQWTHKAPLGYLNVKENSAKTMKPDPDRAPFIREAFERFAAGAHTRQSVLEWVTDRGLRNRRGNHVASETFRRMLWNPLYAGRMVVQGTKEGAGVDWRFAEKGNFEPIVSEETFAKVQNLLSGRKPSNTVRNRANAMFPLRGFVRCGSCDRPLTGSPSKGRNGTKYPNYRCQYKKCSARVNVRKDRLESDFIAFVQKLRPTAEYVKAFREGVISAYKTRFNQSLTLRDQLEKELRNRRDDKWKLNDAYVYRSALNEDDYRQMKEALEQDIFSLEMKINEARQDEIEIEEVVEFAENLLLNAAATWNRSGLEVRQRLQQVLFPEGLTYEDGIYRTAVTNPMYSMLEEIIPPQAQLVALPGIEPGF